MTSLPVDYWDRPEGWTLEDANDSWVGPNPQWGRPWVDGIAASDPDGDFVYDVSALIETIASAAGFGCIVNNVDDTALGVVVNSDKTFGQFLAQHKIPYNFQIKDNGSIIQVVRPIIGADLYIAGTLYERHCIGSADSPAVRITRVDPASLPRECEIQYISADRELAVNSQLARLPGANSNSAKISMAIDFVIYDQKARDIAFDTLRRMWTQAVGFEFEHPDLRYEVGDIIALQTTRGSLVGLIEESEITPNNTNLIKASKLLQVKGGSVPAGQARPNAPVNDNFADAIELTLDTPQTGTNRNATRQSGEPDHAGSPAQRSVWYAYSSIYVMSLTITLDHNSPSDGADYRLAVYTGTGLSDLIEVDSVTGASPAAMTLTIPVYAGVIYYIAVDGIDGAFGDFIITISP